MWEYRNPDELYHWKYIKKVRQNGRWVYYYDNNDGNKFNNKKILETKDYGISDAVNYQKMKSKSKKYEKLARKSLGVGESAYAHKQKELGQAYVYKSKAKRYQSYYSKSELGRLTSKAKAWLKGEKTSNKASNKKSSKKSSDNLNKDIQMLKIPH